MIELLKTRTTLITSILMIIFGCSATSRSPAEILLPPANDSFNSPQSEFRILGAFTLKLNRNNLAAELLPLRKAAITDTLEVVDITGYLITEPCLDCARISKIGLDTDENIVATIGIKHPMDAGNPLQAISWKNRADLHVFNVEGIILSNDGDPILFPHLSLNAPPPLLANPSGYSSYLDAPLDEDTYYTNADIHPYILHFADYSSGNFNPSCSAGFQSVTNPPPSGNLVMPMGSDYDFRDYVFDIPDKEISFLFVVGCTYGISCLSFQQRFYPEYRIPQHLKKAASEVHLSRITEKLQELNPSATATLRVEVVDPSHGIDVGSALDEMAYDSSVKSVEIEIPGALDHVWSQSGDESISGIGHSSSDPLVYEFKIFNELAATVGSYPGIVKVTDNYPPGMNQSIFLNGSDGIKRVEPSSNPLDGLFQIPEFATYATFEIEVELGTPVEQHIYDVGPGYPYADPSAVPWEDIEPNSLIRIHYRSQPYADKWVIARTGLAGQPIIVRGIPDGDKLPIITGENAKTRLELDYWNEKRSVLKIGGASFPNEFPRYIQIENLDIRSAHPNYSFKDDAGNTDTYGDNAASIHIEEGQYITVRGCILHDSGNGLFVTNLSSDVLIEGDYIYDNGNTASAFEHNSYTECKGITFQFNHYGPLKTGSLGNNLKDRSAGSVIRYNWIETGSRMCDLVDSSEPAFTSSPLYRNTYVYGNIFIKSDLEGNGGVIHYGGDSGNTDNYRKGTLWLYNNTLVSYRTSRTTLLQVSTNDENVECFNNILFDNSGGNQLYVMDVNGVVNLYYNWLSSRWHEVNGTLQGTINVHDNIEGSEPGFADFTSQDFHLATSSPCCNKATALPSALLPDNALLYQYLKHTGHEDRPDDGSLDIGAFEFE